MRKENLALAGICGTRFVSKGRLSLSFPLQAGNPGGTPYGGTCWLSVVLSTPVGCSACAVLQVRVGDDGEVCLKHRLDSRLRGNDGGVAERVGCIAAGIGLLRVLFAQLVQNGLRSYRTPRHSRGRRGRSARIIWAGLVGYHGTESTPVALRMCRYLRYGS